MIFAICNRCLPTSMDIAILAKFEDFQDISCLENKTMKEPWRPGTSPSLSWRTGELSGRNNSLGNSELRETSILITRSIWRELRETQTDRTYWRGNYSNV